MTGAPGWVRDESGVLRREAEHHWGRRLPGFDYGGRRIYEITVVLEDRRPVLGRLAKRGERWGIEPSAWGEVVLGCWREIPRRWAQVEIIESCLMPDHFHGIVFVKERLPEGYTLGSIIGGFKAGCTIGWRALAGLPPAYGREPDGRAGQIGREPDKRAGQVGREPDGRAAQVGREPDGRAAQVGREPDGRAGQIGREPDGRAGQEAVGPAQAAMAAGVPRWAEGFVDVILFGKGQLARMIAYLRDNPRRLAVKRENPALFRVLRDLRVDFASPALAPWAGPAFGCFAAIGNHFLLSCHDLRQVQCSRRFFAYARDAKGHVLKDQPPAVQTAEFDEKLACALEAARDGAVIVSPCISHGEREIARRVFASDGRVITLQNVGFSPVYKPGGRLFERCAAGNLLMLAPIAWPHQAAEKPMTRIDAQILNRLAQLIAGEGAAPIDYKGVTVETVDNLVSSAVLARATH